MTHPATRSTQARPTSTILFTLTAFLASGFFVGSTLPTSADVGYCPSVCSYSTCDATCKRYPGSPTNITCRQFGSWNGCPYDPDGDGYNDYPNNKDNCPSVYNPDQKDCDRDGIGAACEVEDIDCGITIGDWDDLPYLTQPFNNPSELQLVSATGQVGSGGGASHFDFDAGGPAHFALADLDPADPIVEVVIDFVSTDYRKVELGQDSVGGDGWSVTFDSGSLPTSHGHLYITANRVSGSASGLLYVVRSGG